VRAAEFATWFGNTLTLTVIVIAVVTVLVARRHAWSAIYVAATASAGGLLNSALKELVGRARPIVEHPITTVGSMSFPSGHAMSSTVIYGALLIVVLPVIPKRWQPAAVAATATLVLAIGASRVVLGVHFPSDVVAGHVVGLAVLLGFTHLLSARRPVTISGEHPR
jgi:undecaprenyl-diphosphatase